MLLFTKYSMDADKPVPVVNIPPVKFIGITTNQGITVNIQESCYPEISVAVIITVGVPVEEYLADIGINFRKVVIIMEYDVKTYWVRSI